MNEYEFTLRFAIPEALDRETLEARLFEAGCDDALVGTGRKGRVALAFARSAADAAEAVVSAIIDVQRACPGPGWSRPSPISWASPTSPSCSSSRARTMRKLVRTHSESFPLPLHEGRSSLWHLADVLDWFERRQRHAVNPMLREVAQASMAVNAAREAARVERHGSPKLRQQEAE